MMTGEIYHIRGISRENLGDVLGISGRYLGTHLGDILEMSGGLMLK